MNVQFSNNPAAQQEPTLTAEGIEVDLGTINEKVTITSKTKLNVNAETCREISCFDQSNTASDAKELLN